MKQYTNTKELVYWDKAEILMKDNVNNFIVLEVKTTDMFSRLRCTHVAF